MLPKKILLLCSMVAATNLVLSFDDLKESNSRSLRRTNAVPRLIVVAPAIPCAPLASAVAEGAPRNAEAGTGDVEAGPRVGTPIPSRETALGLTAQAAILGSALAEGSDGASDSEEEGLAALRRDFVDSSAWGSSSIKHVSLPVAASAGAPLTTAELNALFDRVVTAKPATPPADDTAIV